MESSKSSEREIKLKQRYFEDYSPGEAFIFGNYLVSKEDIIKFALEFDPQPFHLDDEAAKSTHFNGIVSSGWMTGAIMSRLICDNFLPECASMGSPGLTSLTWVKPVRPGDRLYEKVTILKTKKSQSKPDRGVIEILQEGFNQDDELVISMRGVAMIRCRKNL